MLQLLKTRRWIGFTALVIAAIAAFGLLSRWQWARAEEKRSERTAIEQAQAEQPVDLALADPEPSRTATATGTFRAEAQVAVRQRPQNGSNGLWVLAPLELTDGRTVWVARGWIPARGAATDSPDLPSPPGGQVRVAGSWQPFEEVSIRTGLPAGLVAGVDPAVLPLPSEFDGYLIAAQADSAELEPVAAAEIDDGRNISYAVQWLLFAAVAIAGWVILLRREARTRES